MMGRREREQGNLFYEFIRFNLDEVVLKGHLLRRFNVVVTVVLSDPHAQLKPFATAGSRSTAVSKWTTPTSEASATAVSAGVVLEARAFGTTQPREDTDRRGRGDNTGTPPQAHPREDPPGEAPRRDAWRGRSRCRAVCRGRAVPRGWPRSDCRCRRRLPSAFCVLGLEDAALGIGEIALRFRVGSSGGGAGSFPFFLRPSAIRRFSASARRRASSSAAALASASSSAFAARILASRFCAQQGGRHRRKASLLGHPRSSSQRSEGVPIRGSPNGVHCACAHLASAAEGIRQSIGSISGCLQPHYRHRR